MTQAATRLGLSAALLGALAGGCTQSGGGQTGEEQASCWSKETKLAPAEQSPLGFSAQDSLDLAVGEHTATLHWIPPTAYAYGPESGDGELRITLTSLGNARYVTQDDQQALGDLLCAPSVLSDVAVELDSSGGAFHERFQAVLAASNRDSASLSATLLGAHVAGRFAFDPATLGSRTLAQITVNSSFDASSFSGAINAGLQQVQGSGASGSASLESVPLACWGRAAAFGRAGCGE